MDIPAHYGYNGDMRHEVGIRDLRDSLSRWIEKVKAGDQVVVTDHGRPVAMLTPPPTSHRNETEEEFITRMLAEGRLLGGRGRLEPREPIIGPEVDLEGAILEDREETDRRNAE
jgi:prevent-host-death family protein